jgi:cupin superfamily acireductone dioxygenase involved in methionine salvage
LSTNAFVDLEDSEPEPEFQILRFAASHRHEEDCEGAESSWIVTGTQIFPIA